MVQDPGAVAEATEAIEAAATFAGEDRGTQFGIAEAAGGSPAAVLAGESERVKRF